MYASVYRCGSNTALVCMIGCAGVGNTELVCMLVCTGVGVTPHLYV